MNNARRPDAVAALPAQRYVTVIAQDPSVRQNGSNGPILMAKIPAARAAFTARCERVWGTAACGAARTSVPES